MGRDKHRAAAESKLDTARTDLSNLNATEAADKAEADELRAELERERARVDAANLRAEASASAAAGKEAVMGEHDAAGLAREEELKKQLAALEAARKEAADALNDAKNRVAEAEENIKAEQERSKASGDSAAALEDQMSNLQAQLDALRKAKEAAEGKTQESLKAEALVRQQLRALQGGKGISLNGCECKKIFKFNGKTVRTCMIDDSNTQSGGKAFCVVEGDLCGEALEDGRRFDVCAIETKRKCSCEASWVTNGKTQEGCSEFNSKGHPWCKVREDGCGEVNGDGAWWDYCK